MKKATASLVFLGVTIAAAIGQLYLMSPGLVPAAVSLGTLLATLVAVLCLMFWEGSNVQQ